MVSLRKTFTGVVLSGLFSCSPPSFPVQNAPLFYHPIEVVGNTRFKEEVRDILEYLSRTPQAYAFVLEHVQCVEDSPFSEYQPSKQCMLLGPSFDLSSNLERRTRQIQFAASGFVHDAVHGKLYRQWDILKSQGIDAPHFYAGEFGESKAMGAQIEYLDSVGYDSLGRLQTWKKELMEKEYWNTPREEREW